MRKFTIIIAAISTVIVWGYAPTGQQQYSLWQQAEYSIYVPTGSQQIFSDFTERYGHRWSFLWNSETGLPHRIFGEGIFIGEPQNSDDAIQLCRDFIRQNPKMFPSQCTLVPLSTRYVMNTWIVIFRQTYSGLPVLTARADFRIKNGRLVLIGADVFPEIDVNTVPQISAKYSIKIVGQTFQFTDAESDLMVAPFDGGKLVWHIFAKNSSPIHRYHIFVDAKSGEILWWWDELPTISGEVTAMVHPLYEIDTPETVALPYIRVEDEHNDSTFTDSDGNYFLDVVFEPGMVIFSTLKGLYAGATPVSHTYSVCGGGAEDETFDIHFDEECAGIDETGGYYHTNVVHSFFKALDPEYTAMDYMVPVTVSDTTPPCPLNAFWDGYGIHLGAGGAGYYRNFGLYADVIYHEYTHGTTHYIYPSDVLPYSGQPGAMNEAFSDYFACAITGEPYIGELGLIIGQPWMRTLDNDLRYPDDWEGEVHADSRIISASWWEIRENIAHHTRADSLVHFTRFTLANSFDDFAYEMLVLDDDDGNIANGTPNDDEIMEAYIRHGIGGFGVKISHKPHKDTEDTLNPYTITAKLSSFTPIRWANIFYSFDGETFYSSDMSETDTAGIWAGNIPAQPAGTNVYYYLWAEDWRDFQDTLPDEAPESLFSFYIGQDTVPPEIVHNPLWDQSEFAHPFTIKAKISDNIVAPLSVRITFGKNDRPPDTTEMTSAGDEMFQQIIEFDDSVSVGDSIWYAIMAYDGASSPNFARNPDGDGFHSFRIVRSYFYNFEGDGGGFSAAMGWELGTPTYGPDGAYSGEWVWGTRLDGTYSDGVLWILESGDIDISDYSSAILQFQMWMEAEKRFDGGQVLLSVDGDEPQLIYPIGGYTSNAIVAFDGEPGFSGNTRRWTQETFDLSPYIGHTVKIQFVFASDDAVSGAGWYIDDFAILETSFLMPPLNFVAESGYDEMVPLSWDSPSESVDEYLLYRSTDMPMPDEPIAHISSDETSYEDYDVVNGVRYIYWLVASYERGHSQPAGPVSAMPYRAIIAVSPESLYTTLNPAQTQDTVIIVQNVGMGYLTVDIYEIPYGYELHRIVPADALNVPIDVQASARAISGIIHSTTAYAVTPLTSELVEPEPNMWHLLAVDPQEGTEMDIAKLWGQLKRDGQLYVFFRVAGYESFGDPDSFAISFMFDTDLDPGTGFPDGGGIEYMVVVANFMGYEGMVLRYNPDSPYGWDIVNEPAWIYHSAGEDTIEVGFLISDIGSPDAAYMRSSAMAGLAGTTPEISDLVPDSTEAPIEFSFYDARWIYVNPVMDVVPGGEQHIIGITYDTHGVPPGDYIAMLQFKSNDRDNPDLRVPVALHVDPTAVNVSSKPGGIALEIPNPNPFNSSTEIKFSVDRTQHITLAIFDGLGRRVRTLLDEVVAVGTHNVIWDGKDDAKNALPSGIFFVRLSADDGVLLQRIAFIR